MKEEKETKQTKFEELGKYVEKTQKQLKEGFEGVIKEINPITNTDFFDSEGLYDEKEGWALTILIHGDENIEFSQWFSKPMPQGFNQSNLGKLTKEYGKIEKGTPVKCRINENGFYEIVF